MMSGHDGMQPGQEMHPEMHPEMQPQVEYWPPQDQYGQPQQPMYDPYQGGYVEQQQPVYDPYTGGYVEPQPQPAYDAYGQPIQPVQHAQIPQQQHYAQQPQEVTSFFDTGFIDVSKLREYGQGH
jgi:hypothetical protein